MTRQELEKLLTRLATEATVRSVRFVADFTEGRLVCEWEAPDRETLKEFLIAQNMQHQWLARAELEIAPPMQ